MADDPNQTEETAEEPAAEAEEQVAEVEQAEEQVEEPSAASGDEPAEEPAPEPDTAEPAEDASETTAEAAVEETESDSADAEAEADEDAPAESDEPSPTPAAKRKRKRLPRALRQQRTKVKRERPAERRPIVRLPKPEHERGRRQERQGRVVSAAMDKTIVVRVDTVKMHPRYKKVIRRSTKLHAHDETNEAKVGDIVKIVETRPLSRMKRWRLQEIVEAAK